MTSTWEGPEETWNLADEEPRPIPYMKSKTYWSSLCFKSSLDLHRVEGTKGHPATYLLSLCSPLTILVSYGLWNYTAYRSNSKESRGTLCYKHIPITPPTTQSSVWPLHLPTSHTVSPLQEQPPPLHAPSMLFFQALKVTIISRLPVCIII